MKNKWNLSPALKISIASFVFVGLIFSAVPLFLIQNSATCANVENLLSSSLLNVLNRISVSEPVMQDPAYMYFVTENDTLGEKGGYIIADKLHDICCGKKDEQCRTLEDAGIDINKYAPMSLAATDIFGVTCHFLYMKTDAYVIVSYVPVTEQVRIRNINVLSTLGLYFVILLLLFLLSPLVIPFLKRLYVRIPALGAFEKSTSLPSAAPVEEEADASVTDPSHEEEQLSDGDSEDDLSEYVDRIKELKKAALTIKDDKLFKMADYLEKCGKALLAGSKDAEKFRTEIERKTPIALKYYAECIRYHEEKKDMQPSEIFAALEALYEGACSSDKNTVSSYIATFRHVNLPRKLDAVFPSLSVAADQSDFNKIKNIIDSLRTGSHSS
ncbi:MAG: hypothetical protein K5930_10685 [Treponemataceae bacterium]|nr:hypothetical protein [Treponemataceae bacterium]